MAKHCNTRHTQIKNRGQQQNTTGQTIHKTYSNVILEQV